MKYADGSRSPRSLILALVVLFALASLPLLTRARTVSTSVSIVNNSSREIRNVYVSHVDADDWSADVLGADGIPAGGSTSVNVTPCDGQQMKVIGEDSDGCFVSTAISCGGSSTWTITNDTARDCGY
jgi:hypothetical protein